MQHDLDPVGGGESVHRASGGVMKLQTVLGIRVTPAVHERLAADAARAGCSVVEFVIRLAARHMAGRYGKEFYTNKMNREE